MQRFDHPAHPVDPYPEDTVRIGGFRYDSALVLLRLLAGPLLGAGFGPLAAITVLSTALFLLPSLFVGVVAFTFLYVWLLLHRSRAMAMEDLLDDQGLDRALDARRAEAG